jgi:hypothetical protein
LKFGGRVLRLHLTEAVAMPLHSHPRATPVSISPDSPGRRTVPSCRGGASSMLRLAQPGSGPSWFAGAGLLPTASALLQRGGHAKVLQSHRSWAQLSLFPRHPIGQLKK